ncbi:transcriptional regulator [Sphaerisporangium siamense]|uniref:DNA-binding transcriptional ArsR family regulator n=1 Tax=Sphaerisporangium siamense TaxID=795645 RepID=A0A7W7D343_9ACTN|nr:metalloregulator ArsR/SmtB family transcription factor [Sphaerisporangium siamense]MBB4699241.1 DNA-binding transcriptional ArsR family regulator [Sphaerisporangium siamense]GII86632.1 transcriptional regulator [Sphaerisporangium siamense]
MSGWVDSREPVLASVIALTRELADPVRLTALQLLSAEGPHTLTQLADALGVSAPRLGNHLARLRESGLVTAVRTGRHAVYQVASPGLADVLAALARYAHTDLAATAGWRATARDLAHTCYDHAAGLLGVTLFATLVERGALQPPDGRDSALALGRDTSLFAALGVDLDAVRPGRRKLATACLDRTHRLPHLGGVLGKAVLDAFVARGLVTPAEGARELTVTPRGAAELPSLLPGFTAP